LHSPEFSRPIEILLVEDNPADVALTRKAMESARVRNTLHLAGSGDEAMAFLRQADGFTDAPRPHLVLLDLNLPGMDGREVLAELKADAALRQIPVVVLTASEEETDVARSYHNHANCYVTKPLDADKFLQVARCIEGFWLDIVLLPGR
jgi:two-component system, chemotaxis family, response regulator Rcp1